MIIGGEREQVIANIAAAAESGSFHSKVEINDPVVTPQQEKAIVQEYLAKRNNLSNRGKRYCARKMANMATRHLNRDTQIVGLDKALSLQSGAILTCNHFSPLDNTVVRHMTMQLGRPRINIISQISNYQMTGAFGFLMNYADTIPLGSDRRYLTRQLPEILKELTDNGEFVLIYPEQEMWFNYRKPRPVQRGAYYYAAQLNVPILSCFIEMRDTPQMENEAFRKVNYVMHVLDVLYPDPAMPVRAESIELCQKDYILKKDAYERIYGKPLDYRFDPDDIAGWIGALPS